MTTATVKQAARLFQTRGLDTIWFPDVPLVGHGDPFACRSSAASGAERTRMGTFITGGATDLRSPQKWDRCASANGGRPLKAHASRLPCGR